MKRTLNITPKWLSTPSFGNGTESGLFVCLLGEGGGGREGAEGGGGEIKCAALFFFNDGTKPFFCNFTFFYFIFCF